MIRLSIIIPVYNAADYLDVCMYRLIDQVRNLRKDEYGFVTDDPRAVSGRSQGSEVEVITVDDGSTDRSLIILKEYADRYDFIRLIHQENAGPAAARNAGLRMATGDWVWFIDPDDYVDESALADIFNSMGSVGTDVFIFDAYEHTSKESSDEEMRGWEHFREAHVFSSEEDIRVLQRAVLYPNEIKALAGRKDIGEQVQSVHAVSIPKRIVPMAAPWDKVYRHDFLTENHLIYNEELRVLDDMYFNMEVMGKAKRVDYVKKPIYHYVRNDGSITSSYTADRVSRDMVVWDAISEYIDRNGDMDTLLLQAFYERVIKSFAICCKRSIFHRDNHMDRGAQVKYAAKVMRMPEYDEAFRGVKVSGLEWMLRPVVILGRLKLGGGMWLLSRLERIRQR